MLAASCSTAGAADLRQIDVAMRYSRFVPATIEVIRGETVEFEIRNTDPIDHEFILGDELVQERHESGTEAHHGAIPTEVSVPAGQTVTTRITFDQAGKLIIGCHVPGHYNYGMKASVKVEA